MKGDTEVRRRIAEIDGALPGTTTLVGDLTRVIRVMEQVNDSWWRMEADEPPAINPVLADHIVATSETVGRIARQAPALAVGPVDVSAQVWTGAGGESDIRRHRPRQIELAERHFAPLSEPGDKPRTKPWGGGLFTCTLVPGTTTTMWLMYQVPFGGRNSLFPKPWRSYRVEVSRGIRVYEVVNAQAWANLAQRYPLEQDGLLYPDWPSIAGGYDAVHVTVPAIVATQGLRLTTESGTLAETYWDVEQTLWLNWRIDSVSPFLTGNE